MTDRRSIPIADERIREALTWQPDDQAVAADLASIVAIVARSPQRRRSLLGLTSRAGQIGVPAIRLAVALLILVSLLVAIGVFIGSQRRLPPPFGLARPGLIAFDLSGDIYVANADGTALTQLTSGPAGDSQATFSPDGTLIAYLSGGQPDLSSSLMVMGADGHHPIVLADHLAEPGNISWSPDSRRVAIGSRLIGSLPDTFRIYVAEVDHRGAIQLGGPQLYGQDPRWSPNGAKIAFKRDFPCCGGPLDGLWLMDPDGSHLSPLSTATSDPGDTFWNTAWSPDSMRLAFLADGVNSAYDVFVVNSDSTGERDITNSPENEYWPSWSPDGERIAFTRMTVTLWTGGELIVTDPGGSHPVVMNSLLVNSNAPVWSPDARRVLAYAKNADESSNSNDGLAIFDPTDRTPPLTIPMKGFTGASWQRLAP